MNFIRKSSKNKTILNSSANLSAEISNTSNTNVAASIVTVNSSMGNYTSSNNSGNSSSIQSTHEITSLPTNPKMPTSTATPSPLSNKVNKQTLLVLPTTPSLGGGGVSTNFTTTTPPIPPHSSTAIPNNPLSPQNPNNQSTFVLPALNVSSQQQSLRNASNLNFNMNSLNETLPPTTTIHTHSNANSLFRNNSGGGTNINQFSMPKQNARDYRSKLNDAKNFLETETSQLKTKNNDNSGAPNVAVRPSLLTPINGTDTDKSVGSSPQNRREKEKPSLKPFDFKNSFNTESLNQRPSQLNVKLVNNLDAKNNGTQNETPSPFFLNLPTSSRSASPSTPSRSPSSQAPNSNQNRLEAVNSDKFKEIMTNAGYLLINDKRIKTSMDDLSPVCELGSGTCGHVIKMKHNMSGMMMAVKQMRISGVAEENKRIIMDLDVVLKSHDCTDIVKCLGYFISEGDVWICMELMSMCFDKLLKLIKCPIPEQILGKLIVSTLNALNYLKEQHNVIHRDIKPSNILIDENGNMKLCDFGISGNLINSNVMSRNNAGCAGYMAPERIDPVDPTNPVYDIRADVWSLGITLVELATGEYPYKHCRNEFEVMSAILTSDAPQLIGDHFTDNLKSFVNQCLTKDVKKRPKYNILLQHPFVQHYKQSKVDVESWFKNILSPKASSKLDQSKPNTPTELFVEENKNDSLSSTPTIEKSSNYI